VNRQAVNLPAFGSARKGFLVRALSTPVLDTYPDLDPAEGEVLTEELFVSDDVLVKAFALGPGASLEPHTHEGATNVFHVLDGSVVVTRDDEEQTVTAPGVVPNERGAVHGARNESDEPAVLTASLCPLPS
jgi:quercetin dioxygenase-like cupin family protein